MRLGVAAALVDGVLVSGDVEIDGGRDRSRRARRRPGSGIAAPGFVDLQVNGFAGVDLMATDREGYVRVGEALLATGTTAFQPTFVTAPEAGADRRAARDADGGHRPARARRARRGAVPVAAAGRRARPAPAARAGPGAAAAAARRGAGLAGHAGARAAGRVRADRRAGRARRDGSAGHTDATAAEAHLAFDRGVRTVTHLFNAMRHSTRARPEHRDVGARRAPDVIVQVIVDLHHVAPDTVLVALAARPPGASRWSPTPRRRRGWATASSCSAGARCTAADGVVRGPEGQLAGSALTMIEGVRNLHRRWAWRSQDALRAASEVPARVARRPGPGAARARRAGRRRRAG